MSGSRPQSLFRWFFVIALVVGLGSLLGGNEIFAASDAHGDDHGGGHHGVDGATLPLFWACLFRNITIDSVIPVGHGTLLASQLWQIALFGCHIWFPFIEIWS